jgi:hypothetical protein
MALYVLFGTVGLILVGVLSGTVLHATLENLRVLGTTTATTGFVADRVVKRDGCLKNEAPEVEKVVVRM